jgi:hypothetical protein
MNPQPDWQEILREAHREPIDAAHYTAVRARVLAQLEQRPSPWRRLVWLSPLLLLLLLLVPLPRPELPPVQPAWARLRPAGPALAVPVAPAPMVVRAVRRPLPPQPHEPLLIKIQTADPNIVIYWIAD